LHQLRKNKTQQKSGGVREKNDNQYSLNRGWRYRMPSMGHAEHKQAEEEEEEEEEGQVLAARTWHQ
jgi:hypothetical protein